MYVCMQVVIHRPCAPHARTCAQIDTHGKDHQHLLILNVVHQKIEA